MPSSLSFSRETCVSKKTSNTSIRKQAARYGAGIMLSHSKQCQLRGLGGARGRERKAHLDLKLAHARLESPVFVLACLQLQALR
jgi:hypothetical protein